VITAEQREDSDRAFFFACDVYSALELNGRSIKKFDTEWPLRKIQKRKTTFIKFLGCQAGTVRKFVQKFGQHLVLDALNWKPRRESSNLQISCPSTALRFAIAVKASR